MPFYFKNFPTIKYDLKKNNRIELVKNIMLRYKITQIIMRNSLNYFNYAVEDGARADIVSDILYDRPDLDWLLYLVNNVFDTYYDWPLSYTNLMNYIKSKYGSVPTAQGTVHEYRKIINEQSVLFDGTIIPKKTLKIDLNTFNSISIVSKESISKYDYEVELNDEKANIKYIDPTQLSRVLNQIEDVLT